MANYLPLATQERLHLIMERIEKMFIGPVKLTLIIRNTGRAESDVLLTSEEDIELAFKAARALEATEAKEKGGE